MVSSGWRVQEPHHDPRYLARRLPAVIGEGTHEIFGESIQFLGTPPISTPSKLPVRCDFPADVVHSQ